MKHRDKTLISKSEVRSEKVEEIVARLVNPLSSDMDVLRPSLLPGLIHSLRHNLSRKNYGCGRCLKWVEYSKGENRLEKPSDRRRTPVASRSRAAARPALLERQ